MKARFSVAPVSLGRYVTCDDCDEPIEHYDKAFQVTFHDSELGPLVVCDLCRKESY